jgi:hypothetical protein
MLVVEGRNPVVFKTKRIGVGAFFFRTSHHLNFFVVVWSASISGDDGLLEVRVIEVNFAKVSGWS